MQITRSILLIVLLFVVDRLFAQGPEQLISLDKIRRDHFENGLPFDSATVKSIERSSNKNISKIASGLLATYKVEQYNEEGTKDWINLAIDYSWFDDEGTKDQEQLLVDELFRVCVSQLRYNTFYNLNNIIYTNEWNDPLYISYKTYLLLQAGSVYSFLENQEILKSLVVEQQALYSSSLSSAVKSRFISNICSIGLSNFESSRREQFVSIVSSWIPDHIKAQDSLGYISSKIYFSDFSGSADFDTNSTRLVQYLTWERYVPPFLLRSLVDNINWNDGMLELLHAKSAKYSYNTYLFQTLQSIFHNVIKEQKKQVGTSFLGDIYIGSQNQYESFDIYDLKNKNIREALDSCDKITLSYAISEPSWLMKKQHIATAFNQIFLNTVDHLGDKYKSTLGQNQYKSGISLFFPIIQLDLDIANTGLIDNANIYATFFELTNNYYFNQSFFAKKNYEASYDSLCNLFYYINNTGYFNQDYFTPQKYVLLKQLESVKMILESILLDRKKYDTYSKLVEADIWKYDTQDDQNKVASTVVNLSANNWVYYSLFKNKVGKNNLQLFDSLFLKAVRQSIGDTSNFKAGYAKNAVFVRSTARNILTDIYNRKGISDSSYIALLTQCLVVSQLSKDLAYDLDIQRSANDSVVYITPYENSVFCIDNSRILADSSGLSATISDLTKFTRVQSGNLQYDSSGNYIIYFAAADYDKIDFNQVVGQGISAGKNDVLYVAYSDSAVSFVKRLLPIDSLNLIFNTKYPSSDIFISASYFYDLQQKEDVLYDILLKPIENNISLIKDYKIVQPSFLVTIPLDYLYAKRNGSLPRFYDFYSVSSTLFKPEAIPISRNDLFAVFTEFNYDGDYCNISRAVDTDTRSGFGKLKYTREEREAIEQIFTTKAFTGIYGSKENFYKCALDTSYKVLHIATHGVYIPNSDRVIKSESNRLKYFVSNRVSNNMERQLLLFTSKKSYTPSFENNLMTAAEIKHIKDLSHIKLVFLSACETGLIDDDYYSTTGFSGFTKAFLDRGVNSVISTRWKISDQFAATFADILYKNLRQYKYLDAAFYFTKKFFYEQNVDPYLWTSYLFVR